MTSAKVCALLLLSACGSTTHNRGASSSGADVHGHEERTPPLLERGTQSTASPFGTIYGERTEYIAFLRHEFHMVLDLAPGGVRIAAKERSPDNLEWYTWDVLAGTSFTPKAYCSRHANEFFVIGLDGAGAVVLEMWALTPWVNGAYFTEKRISTAPIGTPTNSTPTQLRYTGPFVDPANRPTPSLVRTTLSFPPNVSLPEEIEVDPERRFLILRHLDAQGGSTLTQLSLLDGALTVLASAATHPVLAGADAMMFLDSTERGRLLYVRGLSGTNLYLEDGDNDGVFESSMDLSVGTASYRALPPFTLTEYP